jgi:hypothetical protein
VEFDEELARTRSHENEFVGLPEDEARQLAARLGMSLAVRHSNDEFLAGNLVPSRMTLEVRDGRVVHASAG